MTIVLQFNCTNTLNDQLLEDVVMMMQPDIDECGLEQVASISSAKLEYNVPGVLYLAFQKLATDFPIGKSLLVYNYDLTVYTDNGKSDSHFHQHSEVRCKGLRPNHWRTR